MMLHSKKQKDEISVKIESSVSVAEEISASTNELSESARIVNSSADMLSSSAGGLLSEVNKFKL